MSRNAIAAAAASASSESSGAVSAQAVTTLSSAMSQVPGLEGTYVGMGARAKSNLCFLSSPYNACNVENWGDIEIIWFVLSLGPLLSHHSTQGLHVP